MKSDRIEVIDGFRAVAISLVIGFHYLSKWTPPRSEINLYPYGGRLADFPLFSYGWLGVELFFVVSGFVISLTLLTCRDWREFAWKRFARLFPAMLLCSIVTFIVINGAAGPFSANARDFLPGLTFTEPHLWGRVFKIPFNDIDGAYWSLQVEVKFYCWACFIFFVGSRERFAWRFLLFLNAALITWAVSRYLRSHALQSLIDSLLFTRFLPWFAAGVGFYAMYRKRNDFAGILLIVESGALLAAGSLWANAATELLFSAIFFSLFTIFIYSPRWLDWLTARPIVAVGAASYSLYLLHQSIGITLISTWARIRPGDDGPWSLLVAVATAALIALVSLAIFRYWEVPSGRWLRSKWLRRPN